MAGGGREVIQSRPHARPVPKRFPSACGSHPGLFERGCHSRIGSMERSERCPRKKFRALARAVSGLFAFLVLAGKPALAEIADWETAVRPLDEGMPLVAVMRLRDILKREL